MMDPNIKDLIRQIAGQPNSIVRVGKVVEAADRTVEVRPLDQQITHTVRLKVESNNEKGFTIYPKVNSTVIYLLISPMDGLLLHADEIESIVFFQGDIVMELTGNTIKLNGDSLGGIVKAIELKTQLDKNISILSSLLNVINGTIIAEPGGGSPSALQAALKAALTGKAPANLNNIQNNKVKHG